MMTIFLTGAVYCFAQTDIAVKAKVNLLDGSQLLGTLNAPSLVVVTSFGKKEIPLVQIATLDFAKDGVKVRFHNKDVLSGTLEDTALAFKTVFNDVRLDYSQIKSVQFSGTGARDINTEGLLLHVQFDSDIEDLNRFDARMDARNARIVEGPDGNGNAMLLASEDATIAIHLPFSPLLMPEGTIEFWAKLPQPDQPFGRYIGGQPWLFSIECPELGWGNGLVFGFAYHEGNGKGGFAGRIHGLAVVGTHLSGAVSSVTETGLLGDTPDGWHHYSVVWKHNRFEFPEVKEKVLLLTVDGNVVTSSGFFHPEGFVATAAQEAGGPPPRFVFHGKDSDCTRPIAVSNLKIWNHAKLLD